MDRMRFGLPVAALTALVFAASASAREATVVDVVDDGLSLTLQDGRTARLDGLIAPDPDDDGDGTDADRAAAAARAALLTAVGGRAVRLAPLLEAPDRWGRLPADIHRARDDLWLQGFLLSEGHARIEACPRGDAGRLKRLRQAEAEARRARRGLWALGLYRPRLADRRMRPEGFALVEGRAVATGGGRQMRYLNFAQDWRQDFTLRAARPLRRRLDKAGLGFDALVGRNVRARGWLHYRNGPMITLSCPQQIEAIDP